MIGECTISAPQGHAIVPCGIDKARNTGLLVHMGFQAFC